MKRKKASFFSAFPSIQFWMGVPVFLLGVLFVYGLVSLPPLGETNPTFHVASRYIDQGPQEAAFASPFLSVLLDYRSFDLMILSLFFLTVSVITVLLCVMEKRMDRLKEWVGFFLVIFLFLSLWVLGGIGLKDGGNLMDYEFWAGVFGPSARMGGAIITGTLALLIVITSFLWSWKRIKSGKRGLPWR